MGGNNQIFRNAELNNVNDSLKLRENNLKREHFNIQDVMKIREKNLQQKNISAEDKNRSE